MKSMKSKSPWVLFAVAFIAAVFSPGCCAAEATYHFLKEISVPGDEGWDWLSIDESARRLYVTHGSKIVVIDLDADKITGEIADTPGVHCLAIATDLGLGFSSNGKESRAGIVDLKTLKTLSKVDTGENPDAITYNPGEQEVYAFNGRGRSATVFEAKSGRVLATIPLSGKPEFAVADPAAGRIYCNIEDKSQVAVIDAKTHAVVESWPIAPGTEASGLALDAANHRLFIGCHNQMMVMMDSTNGRVIATVPIGQGVDANMFDPGTGLAFSSNGEGTVTIAHEETPEKLIPVQTLATERSARTMALDPKTHNIYLASAKFEPAPEQVPGAPRQRPKMIPGSFKILVYGTGRADK
jgi:DNA-binding beta-propeller fold protein YncE